MTDPTGVLVLPPLLDSLAVTGGALSGAVHASRKGLDVVGILAVAVCTGVGGGAIRDVILERGIPVFLVSPVYLTYAAFAAVVGYFLAGLVRTAAPALVVLDSLMIGAWVLIGAGKALDGSLSWGAAVFLGVVTAIGGGVLRDLLCGDTPAQFLPGQFYAVAAFAGAVTFVLLVSLGAPTAPAQAATLAVAAGLRFVSMTLDLRSPMPRDLSATAPRWLSPRGRRSRPTG